MNMDDLISRKEAENTIRKLLMETALNCANAGDPLDEFYVDIAHNRLETWISLIPAAPVSVPLDKLCEWLSEHSVIIPCETCRNFSNGYCMAIGDMDKPCPNKAENWQRAIKEWMEEEQHD
jgi:hypothetical protein